MGGDIESEGVIELSEKEKRIIGQRIAHLDYLFTNVIREFGLTETCYAVLYDLLAQMITLANAIGIRVVTLEDLEKVTNAHENKEPFTIYILSELRPKFYNLRAILIAECVRQGVIESFKEVPIGIELEREDKNVEGSL